jgi:hypothetical protein
MKLAAASGHIDTTAKVMYPLGRAGQFRLTSGFGLNNRSFPL